MKMDRLIGILSILLQQERITAPELAEQFEVSRRTIQRDIEALCRAGIPVVTAQGAGGGISIMEGYRVDRTVLTAPELQAILAGLRSLDSVSGTRRYAQLMEKLSAGNRTLLSGGTHLLIDLSSWYKSSLAPKIEAIQRAIEQHHLVQFTYDAPKGTSVRSVEPYYLVFHWSTWYLWGWCQTRQDFRLFKLNRMTDLSNGEPFSPRPAPLPDLDPERIYPTQYQVCVRFAPTCRWRLVEEYGADSFAVQPDGSLLFRRGFPDADSVISWILTFGDGAELLEPLGGLCLGFCTDYRYKTAMNCFGALTLGVGLYGLQGAVLLRLADTVLGVTFALVFAAVFHRLAGRFLPGAEQQTA